MIHTEIKKMSTLERLQTMEELWDSLCQEKSDLESPKWHKDILEERRKKNRKRGIQIERKATPQPGNSRGKF